MDLGETVGKILIFCNVPQQNPTPARLILMIWVVQELIYHEIKEAKPYKLAYGMIVVYSYRLAWPRFI